MAKFKINSLTELNDFYKAQIDSQIQSMQRKDFHFADTTAIKIDEFIGYKISYQDSLSKRQNAESINLFINGVFYIATYSKVNEYNIENKNRFFQSIKITNSKELKQFEEPFNFKRNLLELLVSILTVIMVVYILKKLKKTTGNIL